MNDRAVGDALRRNFTWGTLLTTLIFGCILVAGVHLGAPWLMGAGNRGILTTLAIGEFLGAREGVQKPRLRSPLSSIDRELN